MHGRGWRQIAIVAAMAGATLALAHGTTRATPDMNGQWRLDPRRSDTPPMSGGPGGGPNGGLGTAGDQQGRGGGRGFRGGGGGGMGGGGMGGGGMGGDGGMGGGGGMGRGGGRRWGGGGGGGGESRGSGGANGGGDAAGGARPVRLPDLMHVTQTLDMVSFEDSSGHVLQEITTLDANADTLVHSPGAAVLHGRWRGDTLDVARDTPMGRGTQSYWLDPDGRALVILSRFEASGDRPAREFRRVYRKVVES